MPPLPVQGLGGQTDSCAAGKYHPQVQGTYTGSHKPVTPAPVNSGRHAPVTGSWKPQQGVIIGCPKECENRDYDPHDPQL